TTLAGFDSGSVHVAGYNVDTAPDQVRANIGLVAQNTGVDYFLTGRENLRLQGQLYHLAKDEIEQRITELAAYFELNELLDAQVLSYSGGMRRKLDIATALIHRPKIVFLDEPTLGLDIKSRKSLWSYIEKLNQELNLTILLTTHYLEEADKLAHRVAIINNGQIAVVDTPAALKSKICGDAVTLTFAEHRQNNEELAWQLQQEGTVQKVVWEENRLHLYVEHGATAVTKIAAMATAKGVEISEFSISRPSLDDVFLQYTGASFNETSTEGGEEWWHQWAGKGGGGGGKWAKKWQQQNDTTEVAAATTQSSDVSTEWPAQQKSWSAPDTSTNASTESPPAAPTAPSWPQQNQWGSGDTQEWQKWEKQDAAPKQEK
ncbi:MAG: antibiotic transport system ATP-binding protein, partial [Halothiobacillaceae bacterium]